MNQTETELESFRQKWREEVSARAKGQQPGASVLRKTTQASSSRAHAPPNKAPVVSSHVRHYSEETDEVQPHVYQDLGEKQHGRRLDETSASTTSSSKEPVSALEHYERAVEREGEGRLGDSLDLYRQAFKLDDEVHESYKAKHFPPSSFKAAAAAPKISNSNPSNAPVTVSNTAHHSLHGSNPPSLQSMLDEFSSLRIEGQAPLTEYSPPPPCPISTVPEEILVEILTHLAIKDLASFARLAQVCKRIAYLVATEERVWKRIALGHDYGFAAMHYTWACGINGKPLSDDGEGGHLLGNDTDLDDPQTLEEPVAPSPEVLTPMMIPSVYPTYCNLFRRRPRIRFNGCYISTVNYTRAGQPSPTNLAWSSRIHIVTYYRYLRFLRDGTCISLLTMSEPADVVPYLYVEHMHKNHGLLPSAPLKDALLGRWRLSGPEVGSGAEEGEKEGTLMVETAGATPKYLYKMVLGFGSAGRAARNNKLTWQGYWSYNRLADDWAEFGLKNDRPFYWSRVKSYGKSWGEGGMIL